MPPDTFPSRPGATGPRPMSGDTGWNELMRTLSRTVPRHLYAAQRSTFAIRALRSR